MNISAFVIAALAAFGLGTVAPHGSPPVGAVRSIQPSGGTTNVPAGRKRSDVLGGSPALVQPHDVIGGTPAH
jgi:hypothetical protein